MLKKMLVIPALVLALGFPVFGQSYQEAPYYDSNDANKNYSGDNYNNYSPPSNYNTSYYPPTSYTPAPNSSNPLNGLLTSVLTRALTQRLSNNGTYSPYNTNPYNNSYNPYNNNPYSSYAPYNEPYSQTSVNNLVLPLITTVLQQALRHP